jgi:xanthine dehydrogenase accessory factor
VDAALDATREGRPAALATLLDGETAGAKLAVAGDTVVGTLGGTELLDRSVARDARGFAEQGVSVVRRYGGDGATAGDDELRVYIQSFAPPPEMVIFGAVDFSAALATHARALGYHVTICDARAAFARSPRYTEVADVVIAWPQDYLAGRRLGPRDAVLVFTHDPKFDEPAVVAGLASGAGYIGAMGSRRTQTARFERLRAAGVDEEQLARIAGPCGLDIGARTPEETAISVLAEIIARRTGRAGAPLVETSGSIRGGERTAAA